MRKRLGSILQGALILYLCSIVYALPCFHTLKAAHVTRICEDSPNTDVCCQRIFSDHKWDLYFIPFFGTSTVYARKKRDLERPVQSINARCYESYVNGNLSKYNRRHACVFDCEDTRRSLEKNKSIKHAESIDQAVKISIAHTRQCRTVEKFYMFCRLDLEVSRAKKVPNLRKRGKRFIGKCLAADSEEAKQLQQLPSRRDYESLEDNDSSDASQDHNAASLAAENDTVGETTVDTNIASTSCLEPELMPLDVYDGQLNAHYSSVLAVIAASFNQDPSSS